MLSRTVLRTSRAVVPAAAATRNMATLREIETRLKSVKNIEKITKTMKTVASSKLPKASRAMNQAKVYGETAQELFKNAETKASEGKTLFIVASSDKGLCGGVHSQLSKATRKALDEKPDADLVVLGDKAKAQLQRFRPENIILSFNQIGKDVPSFADAAAIADLVTGSGKQYDQVSVIYNSYVSGIAYEPTTLPIFSEDALKNSTNFSAYEIEDDVLANLAEFTFANVIYAALVEGHACELSARRNAMDNASKNAGEMIDKFTIAYNRTRQAVITNGLIEIIVGAVALDG
ncbi:atp3 gamma subunit of the F1 sector of mitochondrial F1F0 ATP synthase [Savitreella phatthalungensis]